MSVKVDLFTCKSEGFAASSVRRAGIFLKAEEKVASAHCFRAESLK